jgi:hypothetical protein
MSTKKKPQKRLPPKKTKAAKKIKSRNNHKAKEKQMNENQNGSNEVPATSQMSSAIASMLEQMIAMNAKLAELVQIETYLATKALEGEKPPAPQQQPVQQAPQNVPTQVPAQSQSSAAPSLPTRPGAGTIGGLVWDYCDGISKQLGRPITKDELIASLKRDNPQINGQPVNESTAVTQYSKWRSANGLPKLPRGFAARAPQQQAQPTSQPQPQPTANIPPGAVQSFVPSAPAFPSMPASTPQQPIPANAVPSVIQPTATPTPQLPSVAASPPTPPLPPWLRSPGS